MNNQKPVIVIPLDGSKIAAVALEAAKAVTKIIGGILHIVHAGDARVPDDKIAEHLKITDIDASAFTIKQIVGDPIKSIVGYAYEVDAKMIVMASHGETHNQSHLIGSITMGVIQEAESPVLIIRSDMEELPDYNWKPAKMLCPLDGSPMAVAQMQQILSLADTLGVDVDILNVAVHGQRATETGTLTTYEYEDYPQYDMPAWADEFVRRCCEVQPPGVEISMFQRAGEPVATMIDFSSESNNDLIALTWRGKLEGDRAQTVKGLLKETKVPVLLTKASL